MEGERDAQVRHEYVDGQVYAMSGSTARHNRIAGNIFSRFHSHLVNGLCEAFISDVKLLVAPNIFYYPDVMVPCDPPGGDPYFKTDPVLIVEVLSPSTARTDRHEKLAAYLGIGSLQEYLVVAQDQSRIELHRRTGEGGWLTELYQQPEEQIALNSIGLSLSVADIYRNVGFDEVPT
ncbi:MAG: Uma2 family endonuclease [Pyrinomonadaceae bacterium]